MASKRRITFNQQLTTAPAAFHIALKCTPTLDEISLPFHGRRPSRSATTTNSRSVQRIYVHWYLSLWDSFDVAGLCNGLVFHRCDINWALYRFSPHEWALFYRRKKNKIKFLVFRINAIDFHLLWFRLVIILQRYYAVMSLTIFMYGKCYSCNTFKMSTKYQLNVLRNKQCVFLYSQFTIYMHMFFTCSLSSMRVCSMAYRKKVAQTPTDYVDSPRKT